MKIVADENIPFLKEYFGTQGELITKPGRSITRRDLLDATILLVRAVTEVNADLLQDTSVQFVGSTTSGIDHLDTAWLDANEIAWSAAEGCNTEAVVDYVMSTIAALQTQGFLTTQKLRAGVIGVGKIGSRVVECLKIIGFEVIQNDPLRALQDPEFISTPLNQFADLDFISLHTPLTLTGSYPTFHMLDKHFLKKQKAGCVLLNTARGAAIATDDLKKYAAHLILCLDVWENEPLIDLTLLEKAYIATPHIAGYSVQSKLRGVDMIYDAALARGMIRSENVNKPILPCHTIEKPVTSWQEAVLKIYDPRVTSLLFKKMPREFDNLRKHFQSRHELNVTKINQENLTAHQRDILRLVS